MEIDLSADGRFVLTDGLGDKAVLVEPVKPVSMILRHRDDVKMLIRRSFQKIPPIKARHPGLDKDNDTRRKNA